MKNKRWVSRKCKWCNKEIEGINLKHFEELMSAHIFYKHKDKIKFSDLKEDD